MNSANSISENIAGAVVHAYSWSFTRTREAQSASSEPGMSLAPNPGLLEKRKRNVNVGKATICIF